MVRADFEGNPGSQECNPVLSGFCRKVACDKNRQKNNDEAWRLPRLFKRN